MGCRSNPILHVVLNILHFLIGVGMVVISSLTLSKMAQYSDILPDGTHDLLFYRLIQSIIILIVVLQITVCFGLSKNMSYWFSIVLVCMGITAWSIHAIVSSDESFFKEDIFKQFDKFENPKETYLTIFLDKIQNDLECCGVDGPEDWKKASYLDGLSVPDGCCTTIKDGCGADYFNHTNTVDIYQNGCYQVIRDDFSGFGPWFTGLSIASFGVLIIMCKLKSPGMYTLCSNNKKYSSSVHPELVSSSNNNFGFDQRRSSLALPSTSAPTPVASLPHNPSEPDSINPSYAIPSNTSNPTTAYPSSDLPPSYASCVPTTAAPLPYNPSPSYSNNSSYPTNPSYSITNNIFNPTTPPAYASCVIIINN